LLWSVAPGAKAYAAEMGWSPEMGAHTLVGRLGEDRAQEVLVRLLAGEVTPAELVWGVYRSVLLDIGDGHAEQLMEDMSGERLVYWPRAWAARALGYIGTAAVGPSLVAALSDDYWRVRMNAARAIGAGEIEGATRQLVARLADPHPRVRAAAVLALERVGSEDAIQPLLGHGTGAHDRSRAERAVERILSRTQESH
jgi:HEAT repeat protein